VSHISSPDNIFPPFAPQLRQICRSYRKTEAPSTGRYTEVHTRGWGVLDRTHTHAHTHTADRRHTLPQETRHLKPADVKPWSVSTEKCDWCKQQRGRVTLSAALWKEKEDGCRHLWGKSLPVQDLWTLWVFKTPLVNLEVIKTTVFDITEAEGIYRALFIKKVSRRGLVLWKWTWRVSLSINKWANQQVSEYNNPLFKQCYTGEEWLWGGGDTRHVSCYRHAPPVVIGWLERKRWGGCGWFSKKVFLV